MSLAATLGPSLALVLLTFVILMRLALARFAAVRQGGIHMRDIALGQKEPWTETARKLSNSFDNQFQLPVLFHILTAFTMLAQLADRLFVALGWVFVATRILHAVIHAGSNRMSRRFSAYLAGLLVLMAMWLIFATRLLLA